jgi:hypothetical protein
MRRFRWSKLMTRKKTDATDPNDNCSQLLIKTETPDATWTAADCDSDVELVTETKLPTELIL